MLRHIIPEIDSLPFLNIFLEPDMHLWTGNTIPKNDNETYEILKMYRDSDELISWSIIENISKKFIGTYWIVIPQDNEERRIIPGEAQRIGKEFWRMGYTKEA